MKIINKGFRVLILTLILILPSSSIKAFNHENIDVKLIGHRGASAYEPENTIPSFVKAAILECGELNVICIHLGMEVLLYSMIMMLIE